MAKKKAAPAVTVKVTGSCTIYSTFEMRCPLCGIEVSPKTLHQCERKAES